MKIIFTEFCYVYIYVNTQAAQALNVILFFFSFLCERSG